MNKLDLNDLVWGEHASQILGISKSTFDRRMLTGHYKKLRCRRYPKGFRYSIHDVFKIAHPTAKAAQIEQFIRDFRDNKMKRATKKVTKKVKEGVV